MKKCKKCNVEKSYIDFHKNKANKDGLMGFCKICQSEYRKQYDKENKSHVNEKSRKRYKKYYEENKEKINNYNREYAKLKKEKIKKYYEENKQEIEKNKEKKRQEYYEKRKKYLKEYKKIWTNEKIKKDPLFKFTLNVRSNISSSFKRACANEFKKSTKTEIILGCTIQEFALYIEKKFKKGMTFENYGKWHLDHIYPVALAIDKNHLIKLNHYSNFQPLWEFENLSKGKKIKPIS